MPSDGEPPPLSPSLMTQWSGRQLRQSKQFGDSQRLICPIPSLPAPAILTAPEMFAHPHEPRRFTIAELRVICGFPADYILRGSYAEQWARLGNAVPPLMMRAIAQTLRDGLFTRLGRTRSGFTEAGSHDESNMTKPVFKIPSMTEVAAARGSTGLTVVSTFSGCGGSCLGFEMAGYRVLWANEFLPIARESYAANHPETILDGRDIRRVEAPQILDAIGLEPGELDVFNGSPPCQAFSTAGKRDKGWGTQRDYGNGVSQKNEDLFFEYVRLLKGLQPRAFVAENVAGLTRGVALGYFKEIMRGLVACGYVVKCKVLDAQWLGVPQTRTRAIFIGVRSDLGLGLEPEFPKPLPYRYSLREVLPGLSKLISENTGSGFTPQTITDQPVPAILANCNPFKVIEREAYLTEGSKALKAWQANRPGEMNWAYRGRLRRTDAEKPAPAVLSGQGAGGGSTAAMTLPNEARRFTIAELQIICGFPADFELKGKYAEQWARLGNAVPPLMMREIAAALRDGPFAKLGRTQADFREAR
jgi:DNA (cytosine-5)-methyltransferase 1